MSATIAQKVSADLLKREAIGIVKYGVELGAAKLSRREHLQHAYEEALNLASYLKAEIEREDKETAPVSWKYFKYETVLPPAEVWRMAYDGPLEVYDFYAKKWEVSLFDRSDMFRDPSIVEFTPEEGAPYAL